MGAASEIQRNFACRGGFFSRSVASELSASGCFGCCFWSTMEQKVMLKVRDRAKLLASQQPGSGDTEEPVLDLGSSRAAVSQGHKPLGDHSAPCPARKSSWTNPCSHKSQILFCFGRCRQVGQYLTTLPLGFKAALAALILKHPNSPPSTSVTVSIWCQWHLPCGTGQLSTKSAFLRYKDYPVPWKY